MIYWAVPLKVTVPNGVPKPPKVFGIMAFWAILVDFGLLFYLLFCLQVEVYSHVNFSYLFAVVVTGWNDYTSFSDRQLGLCRGYE